MTGETVDSSIAREWEAARPAHGRRAAADGRGHPLRAGGQPDAAKSTG
jgi:hypothetical protein